MRKKLFLFLVLFLHFTVATIVVTAINIKVNEFSSDVLYKMQSPQQIPSKVDGTKVVNNNSKKNGVTNLNAENQFKSELTKNSIKKIWEGNDGFLNVVAELSDAQSEVKITIYNMLGKEVKKVYSGLPEEKDEDGYYIFTSQAPLNLPKNIYILVIQGNTFKVADKFIIAK
jgi:hypothetical protein